MSTRALRFGPFTLLSSELRLLRDDNEVQLGQRALQVLSLLAQRPGELVGKDELLDTVWRGLVVEEANLHVQVSLLRKAVGADAVVTVPGRGYRFALPVDVVQAAPSPAEAQATSVRRLSVLVLPFVESGAPPGQAYFADAVTDEITTQLSRIRGSFVIGVGTALTLRDTPPDIGALARELGVRHVLQGRLERSGQAVPEDGPAAQTVEANVRLTDAATGAVAWSDLIEVQRASLPQLRRELVARLAVALDMELVAAEAHQAAARPVGAADADDLLMEAVAVGRPAWTRDRTRQALDLCEQARRLQPDHAPALALCARFRIGLARGWPGAEAEAQIAQAEADILRALAHEPLVARSHHILAIVRQQQFRLEAALVANAQALELDPNDPRAWGFQGELLLFAALPEQALEALRRALEISPRDPLRWAVLHDMGACHMHLGQYQRAADCYQQALSLMPYHRSARQLAAALAHLGRLDEAWACLQRVPDLTVALPGGTPVRPFWARNCRNPVYLDRVRQHQATGMVKAGVANALAQHDAWAAWQRAGGQLENALDRLQDVRPA
jgi:DNA-binding winged helix-turn-helix (wHTH) protein/tetratricopeptide (TPR) repeat protein